MGQANSVSPENDTIRNCIPHPDKEINTPGINLGVLTSFYFQPDNW